MYNTVNVCVYIYKIPQFILYITVYILFYYSQFYIYTYIVTLCVVCYVQLLLLYYSILFSLFSY